MSELRIDLRGIGKRYQLFQSPGARLLYALGLNRFLRRRCTELWALQGITLAVRSGERVGIIGRNGAGKSTLLKIIAGIVAPTCGDVHVDGRVRALLELGIGFHPELTGRENVKMALAYGGEARNGPNLEEEIIEFAELHESIDQPLRTFSSGMFTRLAFSVATAIPPEVLVVDEILSTGDAYFSGKCFERMKKLSDESGATIVMTSHDLSSIQALCHRVVWIDRGVVKAEGPTLEVLREYGRSVRQDEESRLRKRDDGVFSSSGSSLGEALTLETQGYGSKEIVITGVKLHTSSDCDVKTLSSLEPFEVVVGWETRSEISNPVFVFCIYLTTGECVSQWIVSAREMGVEVLSGKGHVSFKWPQLFLGTEYYVASVGIFKQRPDRGLEPPAFHVLDRSFHFRIVNHDPSDSTEYGMCRHPVDTQLHRSLNL